MPTKSPELFLLILVFLLAAGGMEIAADNPYFHREMSLKELWKLYRFAYQQKNYKAHYDRYYKNRLFRGTGTIIGFRHASREGGILSVAVRHRPCGYSIILWAPNRYLPAVSTFLAGLKIGDEIEFAGEFLETYRSDHLRLVLLPRMVQPRAEPKPRHFRDSFE